MRGFASAVVLCMALIAPAGHAAPQASDGSTRDPVQAEALFTRALELLDAGDSAGACERFDASMKLDPAAATQMQIARCRASEGKLSLAWYEYQRALKLNRELTQSDAKRQALEQRARQELALLDPRIPRLKILLAERPAGLVISRNGQPLAVVDDDIRIDAGEHVIVAEAPGRHRFETRIQALEGKTATVTVVLLMAPAPPVFGRPPPPQPIDAAKGTTWSARRIAGASLIGAGAAGLGVGLGLGIFTAAKIDESNRNGHCDDSGCDTEGFDLRQTAKGTQIGAFVAVGIGAAALATGLAVWLTAPRARQNTAMAIVAAPGGAGARVRW